MHLRQRAWKSPFFWAIKKEVGSWQGGEKPFCGLRKLWVVAYLAS